MSDQRHIRPEDFPLYAMRLLGEEEDHVAHQHLRECALCRRELDETLADLSTVALTAELAMPRVQARERLLGQVGKERRVVPIDRKAVAEEMEAAAAVAPAKPARRGSVLPWLGWALAAGATFFAVSEYRQRGAAERQIVEQAAQMNAETVQRATLSADVVRARALMEALTASTAMRVTLNTTPAAKPLPQGRANYVAEKGALVFIASNLEPLPADKVYELWIIPQDGSSAVAAGTFSPDARGNASVILPEIPKGIAAKAFGVTMEAEGGSTKPSLPILMMGAGA